MKTLVCIFLGAFLHCSQTFAATAFIRCEAVREPGRIGSSPFPLAAQGYHRGQFMIIHSEGGLSHYGFAVGNRAGGTLSYSKVENLGVATNNGVWTYRFEQEVAESAEPQYATLLTRNRYELILNSLNTHHSVLRIQSALKLDVSLESALDNESFPNLSMLSWRDLPVAEVEVDCRL